MAPPRPVEREAPSSEPPRWPWLKRVTTLSERERVSMGSARFELDYTPPVLKRVTLLPTASTVPAPSDPGMTLSFMGKGYPPLGMMRSR
jgi:hypothetical protein